MVEPEGGICSLCGHSAAKPQMSRHLVACVPRHDTRGPKERLLQLRVEAGGDPAYWLYLEARSNATLEQLDALLREVWLECCGHMSAFRLGRTDLEMGSRIGATFRSKGAAFEYEYDFGSTTELKGRVVAVREGSIGRGSVRVLARNAPLVWKCANCDAPATVVCPFCGEPDATFCRLHGRQHACAEEGEFLPIVNSPRMGVCGYTG